jgi:hypothetical protein
MTAIPRFHGDFIDRHGRMDAALESYAGLSSLISADLTRRHDAHKAQCQAAGDRIDRFLEHTRSQQGGSNHG